VDIPVPGPIEFGKHDALELAQDRLSVDHWHEHALPQEQRPQVSCGVLAVTIGKLWAIVLVELAILDDPRKEIDDVLGQGCLGLGDEDGRCRVL
jgi:hypothetical protein